MDQVATKPAFEKASGAATLRNVSTFWHGGTFQGLDLACLRSFVIAGYDVCVYSYHPIGNLPAGTRAGDARDIADERLLHSFIVGGRPSISHFSDFFRYNLFLKAGSTWIDTDLVCLPNQRLPEQASLFGRQTQYSLNNAVMRIAPDDPRLPILIRRTEELANKPLAWGATGPNLVTEVFGSQIVTLAPEPKLFYPVHWDDWFLPFLPSMRERCETQCADAVTLHLWNNIVEHAGYWKELAPPEGSYLHARFKALGLLENFRDVCPERLMVQLFENWRHSVTGDRFSSVEIARIVASRVFQDRHKPIVKRLRAIQAQRLLRATAGHPKGARSF